MPGADEFECLNLNISVPRLPIESQGASGLPVMVFIHGGAFAYSMGSSPIYDGRLIASSSDEVLSSPTIVVTLNYRLGVYGFLAGTDLRTYNEEHGETGVGNYGIWDQVIALRWIQKHISAFGGDPAKVTLFGQSAGGISVHCHLLRNEPLFSSAILQSGMNPLLAVNSVDEYQTIYENMLTHLGISLDAAPEDRVKNLLSVPAEELTKAMIPAFIIPVISMPVCDDKVIISQGMSKFSEDPSTFQAPEWCPRIMIGDCRNEGIIFNKSWSNMSEKGIIEPDSDVCNPSPQLVIKRLSEVLGESKAAKIADLYSLSKDSSPKDIFDGLERLSTHGLFTIDIYLATLSAAAASSTVYAWHFDVPSPFENAWNGLAHHSLDNVLLWGVLRHKLPEAHKTAGDLMVEGWVKFANGEEPWERFSKQERWMIFGLEGCKMASREEDDSWGYSIWEELRKNNLVQDMSLLSQELCLRREELLGHHNL
jgi:carboxylesterase type B